MISYYMKEIAMNQKFPSNNEWRKCEYDLLMITKYYNIL